MLIWGTRGKVFKSNAAYAMDCPACGQREHLGYALAQYFHLFWIPTVLWEKEVGLICTHCQRATSGNEVSPQVRTEVKQAVLSPLKRLPYFTGLFLIAALIASGIHANAEQKREMQGYVADPHIGDIYVADMSEFLGIDKTDDIRFGLLRIIDISEGQAMFKAGNILSNKPEQIKADVTRGKALAEEYYLGPALVINKADLRPLMDNGTFKNIIRKQ